MITPLQRYQQLIDSGALQAQPHQAEIIAQFEHFFLQRQQKRSKWFRGRRSVQWLYLWGSVGSGKTLLLNLLHECLPERSVRMHFHEFMYHIHEQLRIYQGQKDPLEKIAKALARQYDIIFLDEWMVVEIVDAMILAGLLAAFVAQGIDLVCTSNTPPDDLYANGLQRSRFLPAIELLKQHAQIISLNLPIDFRVQGIPSVGHLPEPGRKPLALQHAFAAYTDANTQWEQTIEIEHRSVPFIACSQQAIWFDFEQICHAPRSQNDYLQLAARFPIWFVSNFRPISAHEDHTIRYLINLIDILYDQHIYLRSSGPLSLDDLYPAGRYTAMFQRTLSRLQEMQTQGYWQGAPHG
jgi:cell division protein ZapE